MAEPVRRLTEEGIRHFRAYLEALRAGSLEEPPTALLRDAMSSEPFAPDITIGACTFETRLEVGRYLTSLLEAAQGIDEDIGLWSWLSLYFFDQVCPRKPDGTRTPGRDYRHVLEPGYRYGHAHLLNGAYVVYRLHGESARLLLCTKPHQENSFHHQLASRQVLISNPSILRAATLLYLDARTRQAKPRAQIGSGGPGTLRRFIDVIQQLDVNYDLYSMSPEAIVGLFPEEFGEWLGSE